MSVEPTDVAALVPLRTGGKTRLGPALDPRQRATLAGAMLADVVAALHGAGIRRVVVAAEGPAALAAAGALDLEVIEDPPAAGGLDAALRHATAGLGDPCTLLVVAADLPALAADDVAALLRASTPVAVAPTGDGGTGGLLRRPPSAIPTAYGEGSAVRHERLARAAGLPVEVVRRRGFAHDVDVLEDVLALEASALGPATTRVLDELRLRRRAG